MQLLNCLVALGGDSRNTVPKSRITVAEAHALRAIHGSEALLDVEPLDEEVSLNLRTEIARLIEKYPSKDEDSRMIVQTLFSGGAASVPEDVEDLELPEGSFKVISRVVAKPMKRTKPKGEKKIANVEAEDDPNSADHFFE